MFCKNCGSKIKDGHKFCTECGEKVESTQQEQKQEQAHHTDCSEYTGKYEYQSTSSQPSFTFEQMSSNSAPNVQYKSKIIAGLLAILMDFGIYSFYLGYFKKATIQLVITIFSLTASVAANLILLNYGATIAYNICCVIYLLASLSVRIWGFVDGIRIFTGKLSKDGKGMPIQ